MLDIREAGGSRWRRLSAAAVAGAVAAWTVGIVVNAVTHRAKQQRLAALHAAAIADEDARNAASSAQSVAAQQVFVRIPLLGLDVKEQQLVAEWHIALVHSEYPLLVVQFQCATDVSRPQLNFIVEDLVHNAEFAKTKMGAWDYIEHSRADLPYELPDEDIAHNQSECEFEFTQPLDISGRNAQRRVKNYVAAQDGIVAVVQLLCRDEEWSYNVHREMLGNICRQVRGWMSNPTCSLRDSMRDNYLCLRCPSKRDDRIEGFSCLIPVQRYVLTPLSGDAFKEMHRKWPHKHVVFTASQPAAVEPETTHLTLLQFASRSSFGDVVKRLEVYTTPAKAGNRDVLCLASSTTHKVCIGVCPSASVLVLVGGTSQESVAAHCRNIVQSIGPYNGTRAELDYLHGPSGFRYRFPFPALLQSQGEPNAPPSPTVASAVSPRFFSHFFGHHSFEMQPFGTEELNVRIGFLSADSQGASIDNRIATIFPNSRQINVHHTHEGWFSSEVLLESADDTAEVVVRTFAIQHLGFIVHVCWTCPADQQAHSQFTALNKIRNSILLP